VKHRLEPVFALVGQHSSSPEIHGERGGNRMHPN
jgi:hypothetical protein